MDIFQTHSVVLENDVFFSITAKKRLFFFNFYLTMILIFISHFFQMFFQMNKEIKIWHTYHNKLVPLNRDRFTINWLLQKRWGDVLSFYSRCAIVYKMPLQITCRNYLFDWCILNQNYNVNFFHKTWQMVGWDWYLYSLKNIKGEFL